MNEEKKKVGRPKKKEYDEDQLFKNLMNGVDYCFECTGEIKATAEELGISATKVKKLLITSGRLEYDETKQIQRLMAYGKSINEIQKEMGLKKSSINSYLPYSKIPYKSEEISSNADRCDLYRKRRAAVDSIIDLESLWNCLTLFSGYPFRTLTGDKFSYEIGEDNYENDRSGKCIRELLIVPKKEIISMSSVEKAYENAMTNETVKEPIELGNMSGVEYLYSIFLRFRLVDELE